MSRYASRIILAIGLLLSATAIAYSQKNSGFDTRLVVTALSASQDGAVVVGARVVLKSGKVSIVGITNADGEYIVRLPRRNYTMTVSAYGFDRFERRNFRIRRLPLKVNADLVVSEISSHN